VSHVLCNWRQTFRDNYFHSKLPSPIIHWLLAYPRQTQVLTLPLRRFKNLKLKHIFVIIIIIIIIIIIYFWFYVKTEYVRIFLYMSLSLSHSLYALRMLLQCTPMAVYITWCMHSDRNEKSVLWNPSIDFRIHDIHSKTCQTEQTVAEQSVT